MRPLALALALAGGASSAAPPGHDVQGEWWTPGFNARVRIEACGGDAVCGRIVWLWDDQPQGIADKTPQVGKPVIEQMKFAEAGRWTGGWTASTSMAGKTTFILAGWTGMNVVV